MVGLTCCPTCVCSPGSSWPRGTEDRRTGGYSSTTAVPGDPRWAGCDLPAGRVVVLGSVPRSVGQFRSTGPLLVWLPAGAPTLGRNRDRVLCPGSRRIATALAGGVPRIGPLPPTRHIRDTHRDATQPLASRTGTGRPCRWCAFGVLRWQVSGAQALVNPHVVAIRQMLAEAVAGA